MLREHTEEEYWKQWRVKESFLLYEPSIAHPPAQTVFSMTWRWQRDGEHYFLTIIITCSHSIYIVIGMMLVAV